MNNNSTVKQFTTVYHESLGQGYVVRVNSKDIVYCSFQNNAVSFISLSDLLIGDRHIALHHIEPKKEPTKKDIEDALSQLFGDLVGD